MRPVAVAGSREAAVAAGHGEACRAAIGALADGGTVADAAVAAAFVLTVVCPHAATLGGDAFLLIRNGEDGQIRGLNGSGRSPRAATAEGFPDGIPRSGFGAATVPGLPAALAEAAARFGRLPLARLTEPALALARDGFPVDATLGRNAQRRAELLAGDAEAARLFLPAGRPLAEGEILVQPALADSLALLARDGPEAFYRGALAERLCTAASTADGLLAPSDLAAHETLWQEPISASFHGREILTMPPNSQGLTLLLQLIALKRDEIGAVDPSSAGFVLRGLAARRLAHSAANRAVGDPEATEAEARRLLAEAVAAERVAPGPEPEEVAGGTTAVVVLDRAGNAVCLLASVSAPFGAGVIAPGTGILLNNRMRGFSTVPDSPNALRPARRPAHTLAPAMVLKDGRPELVLATPGQAGQTCTLAQILARLLACGQAPEDAIAAPRWSVDLEGRPVVEDDLPGPVAAAVAAAEPRVRPMPRGWITFGSVKACIAGPDGPVAYADRRRSADAAGI